MKTIILILKGILLYGTLLAIVLLICSIDSLYSKGYILPAIAGVALLIYGCFRYISEEEADILTGVKFFKNMSDEW